MPYNSCNSQLEKFAKAGYNYNNLFFKLKGEQIYERIIKKCKLRGGGASQLDGIQEFKKSRCQAVYFNVILHLLQNLKFVKERSRNRCAMTEQFSVILNLFQDLITQKLEGRQLKPTDVKKSGGQASLEGKKIRRYEGKLFTLKSLSSNPPTLLSSNNQLLPLSRKGRGKSTSRFTLHPSLKKLAAFTLAEGATHVDTSNYIRRAAFTLAEVLITLGIIGIVAALTMPSLIANYKKKETVTRLKKAYSVVQQAIKMSELDNGEVQYWNIKLNGREFFNIYFDKYFQYTKKYTSSELWNIAPRKLLNGSNYTGTTYASDSNGYHIMLADGVLITLHYGSENCIWVGIDTNGLAFPNQIGRDTFLFVFTSQYGLQPLGGQGTTADGPSSNWSYGEYNRDKIIGGSSLACNVNKSGYWCAALIMNDGWEMAKDYPW